MGSFPKVSLHVCFINLLRLSGHESCQGDQALSSFIFLPSLLLKLVRAGHTRFNISGCNTSIIPILDENR